MTSPPVVILLATRNGAAFLPAQLDSLSAQSFRDWSLIVSDDGSTDATAAIVDAFAARVPNPVRRIAGPQRGATTNFLSLLRTVPEGHAAAFCDQDDVWMPEKLAWAAEAMGRAQGPVHYSAPTMVCDRDLTVIAPSPRFKRPYGLANALVQACTAGNTSVFSPEAATILRASAGAAEAAGIVSHDWWAYQVIAAVGGTILRDARPALLYRQHGDNAMGRNDTAAARLLRLSMLFDGRFGRWLAANHRALTSAGLDLPAPQRALLDGFGRALRAPGPAAAARLARLRVYRHDRAETAALLVAAAAGRLRSPAGG